MNIQLASDLHLDFHPVSLPGGEVLLLLGDVFEARYITKDRPGYDKIREVYQEFCQNQLTKYDCVLYVLGNHEYYGGYLDTVPTTIQGILPPNTTLLQNQAVQVGSQWFWGGTLWTDLNRMDPTVQWTATKHMSDFRMIKTRGLAPGPQPFWTTKFTVHHWLDQHKKALNSITQAAESHSNLWVLTHHTPSTLSRDVARTPDQLDWCYHNRLEAWLEDHPNVTRWCHGHCHHTVNYQVYQCTINSNPRGYHGYEQQSNTWTTRNLD